MTAPEPSDTARASAAVDDSMTALDEPSWPSAALAERTVAGAGAGVASSRVTATATMASAANIAIRTATPTAIHAH